MSLFRGLSGDHSRGFLKSVDFRNNDFGHETEHIIDAVLTLEREGSRGGVQKSPRFKQPKMNSMYRNTGRACV